MRTRLVVIRGDAAGTRLDAVENFARNAEKHASEQGWTILQVDVTDVSACEEVRNFRVTSTFIAGGTVLFRLPPTDADAEVQPREDLPSVVRFTTAARPEFVDELEGVEA
jgi:hypothetical protein